MAHPTTQLCRAAICSTLGVLVLACGAPDPDRGTATAETSTSRDSAGTQAPPPPVSVPANRCLAQAIVISVDPGPARSTVRLRLPGSDETLSELELRLLGASAVDDGGENLCVPETTIRAYLDGPEPAGLAGQRVEAELELVGSTKLRHWWVHRVLAPS